MTQTTFGDYGFSFQIKLLAAFISDASFYQQIGINVEEKYFDSEANKSLIKWIKEYYTQYNSCPTKEFFKVQIQNINNNDVLKLQILENYKQVKDSIGAEGLDFIKHETIKFCRNQEYTGAIYDCVELIERGELDAVPERIEQASKVGIEPFQYYDYKKEVDNRYSEEDRNPIPTGWDVINDITHGGSGAGELFIFISSAGGGKSWTLVNVGGSAVKLGKTVFHYTLELYPNYTGKRYDAYFTGVDFHDLKFQKETVVKSLDGLPGNIIVEYYPAGTLSTQMISAHIDQAIFNGITPDMIIVDYADLMKSNVRYAKREKRYELSDIYVELRGLAGKYKIPCITASQGNRSSSESEIITGAQVSEDYSKIMTGDVVISLARPLEQKSAGFGSWYIIKNRFGPDGLKFVSKINTGNGDIQIFDKDSRQGKEINMSMQNSEELTRKLLSTKYNQLKNNRDNIAPKLTKFD
jgi:replicative DNA helicase